MTFVVSTFKLRSSGTMLIQKDLQLSGQQPLNSGRLTPVAPRSNQNVYRSEKKSELGTTSETVQIIWDE
jgi:hypothetical protein